MKRVLRSQRFAALTAALIVGLNTVGGQGQEPAETKSKAAGLFDGLKKLIPKDTRALRENIDSALKSGSEELKGLLESASVPNEKMGALLAYLDRKLAGREPAFSNEQVQAHALALTPIIEELSQRKFSEPPQVKTVGTLQLIQALAQDLVPQLEKRFPGVSKPVIYLRAYLSAGIVSPSLLGKYSYTTRTVYVVPTNLDAVMQQKGISAEHREKILQIVIGHELVHGLQDQEVDLKRTILTAESPDALNAANAVIEGHAVFLQNALAGRLKYGEAARKASELFMVEDLKEDAWVYERLSHVQGVLGEQIYMGGARFVAYHHGRGGMAAIWNILVRLPQRSSMITQPETYTTVPLPNPDYHTRFVPLRANAGLDDGWAIEAAGVGDFQLRGVISPVDRATRERLMQGLSEAVMVEMLHKTDLARGIEIALFRFKSEQEATMMVDTAEKMSLQDFKDMERNPGLRLRDQTRQPYSLGPGTSGIGWCYTVEAFLLGKNAFTRVIVRHGNTVANVVESGSGLTPPQLAKLISESIQKMKP
jgi:hypothetical protein